MIRRADIIWLGVSAAVTGALLGGLLLGLGLAMAVNHQPVGLLFIVPSTPLAGGVGWLLARRLVRKTRGS